MMFELNNRAKFQTNFTLIIYVKMQQNKQTEHT